MSSNPSENPELAALFQANEIGSLKSLIGALATRGVDIDSRGQAQPKTEAVLTNAGFTWDADKTIYRSDRGYQTVIAYPQRIYVWSYASVGKYLPNTAALSTWLAGPNQEFLTKLMQLSGEADPINVGTATERPTAPTQDQEIDAIIAKIKPGARMKADSIIDLYKKAKETGSEKLMALVKTLKTPDQALQESIKKSDLRMVIKEIVNTIIKEAPFKGETSDDYFKRLSGDATGNSYKIARPPEEAWVEDFANKTWKDPQDIGKGSYGLRWKISKVKQAETGETVYHLSKTKTVDLSRFVIKRGDSWYYLDPNTKKWIEMSERPPVAEMTTTAAVAPVQTPNAFKNPEEEQIEEMTTTDGGTPGYMIPGAFGRKGGSKKGVEGSAALGYTLTPIGKKEMQKTGDPL